MKKTATTTPEKVLDQWEEIGKNIKQALDADNQSSNSKTKQEIKKIMQESIHALLQIAESKGISLHECIYGTINLLDETLNPGMFIFTSNLDKKRYYAENNITLEGGKMPESIKKKLQKLKDQHGKIPKDLIWNFWPNYGDKKKKRKKITEKDFE